MFKDHLIFSNNIQDAARQIAAKQILEAQRDTEDVIITDAEREEGEDTPNLIGHLAKGKGAKRGRPVTIEPGHAIPGESKQTEIHHAVELANGDADKNNIYTSGKAIRVNKNAIHKR